MSVSEDFDGSEYGVDDADDDAGGDEEDEYLSFENDDDYDDTSESESDVRDGNVSSYC